MKASLRRPRPDPLRAAMFRDIAGELVRKDRANRKVGLSVDTAGAVARALEQAYRLGFEEGQSDPVAPVMPPPDAPIVWDLIPRRPRKALWYICGVSLGDGRRPETPVELFPALTAAGAPGWRMSATGAPRDVGEVLADREMAALAKRGLVTAVEGSPRRMALTARGRATWRMALDAASDYPER